MLTFTVTPLMFSQLCELEEKSFLYKPFLQRLRQARGGNYNSWISQLPGAGNDQVRAADMSRPV